MPNIKCYVFGCKNNLSHRFPKNPERRALWLEAIGRTGDNPRPDYGLCSHHFTKDDFSTVGWDTGVVLVRKRLKRDVLPSVGLPAVPPKRHNTGATQPRSGFRDIINTTHDLEVKNLEQFILPNQAPYLPDDTDQVVSETSIDNTRSDCSTTSLDVTMDSKLLNPSELCEVVMPAEEAKVGEIEKDDMVSKAVQCDKPLTCGVRIQTVGRQANYTIFDYQDKPNVIQYFTGLDSYSKFICVFKSLKTEYDEVVYRNNFVLSITLQDQLFMTMWKLRKNTPDFELALHFGVSQTTVSNIVVSIVAFMAKQWGDLNTWPQKSLVDLYMPENLKKSCPSAKVVTDKTQVSSTRSSENGESRAPQSTLKTVDNINIVKVLVGANVSSPTVQKCSSVTDQIVEDCDILKKCKVGDLIMVDQSFNVGDLFGSKGVVISIPPSLKGNDPALEMLIGHAKSYKILAKQLNPYYMRIASEIFYVCVMLCHYRNNIIIKK